MDDRQREIDRRIRRAQRALLFAGLREHALLITVGIAFLGALGFGIVWNSMPDKLEATVLGRIVRDDLEATRRGAEYHKETVQLPSGIRVTINLSKDDAVRPDEPMRVEILQKDLGPLHHVTYRFAGYADEPVRQAG